MAWNQNDFAVPDYFNTVEISPLQQQLDDLTILILKLAVGNAQPIYPMFREDSYEQPQWNYDPHSNTCNSEWMDYHDFSYDDPQMHWLDDQKFSNYQQFDESYPNDHEHSQYSTPNLSLEDMFQSFMTGNLQFQQDTWQFQQETNENLQRISVQMEQLKFAVSQLEVQSIDKLPYHIMMDQEDDEIVLISGKNEDTSILADLEHFADSSTRSMEYEEEIELTQELKETTISFNSLPFIFENNAIFSIPLPVTHNNFVSFDFQKSIPDIKVFPNHTESIFLEEGAKPSYPARKRSNLPIRNVVMNGVRKIHEIGVT